MTRYHYHEEESMIVTTLETIPGYEIKEVFGIANGNVVQSKHIGRDIGASLKTIIGGEIKGYTELMTESRNIATDRMIQDAENMGANAVVGFRIGTAMVMTGASEVFTYGTAVRVEKV